MASRTPLPAQSARTPWPIEAWPKGSLEPEPARVACEVGEALFADEHIETYGQSHALLMVQRGRIVFEQYDEEHGVETTLRSWSMAKSIVHAIAGMLIGDGQIGVEDLASVPGWQQIGDLRSKITIDHLLRMTDGLAFQEDWVEGEHCDCIDMLYQKGKHDTADYARRRPGRHEPGTHWNYSSGTTNVLAALLGEVVGGGQPGMSSFLSKRLFEPLGMRSAKPRFDRAGTFISSSFLFATARDFARFGLLYLRDGIWDGHRRLPEGWVDHARTPTPASAGAYGAHWWLERGGPGTFSAVGFEGQYLHLDPARDVIVVRTGVSEPEQRVRVEDELTRLIASAPYIT